MKKISTFIIVAIIMCGVSKAQTKLYHGVGVSIGSILKAKNSAKNAYIHPEYEINVLHDNNRYIQGFVGGAGFGYHAFNDGASTRNNFLSLKGGYKIDAFAFGVLLNFMDGGTAPGGWANANVSDRVKFQVSYSKYSYLTGGVLYFPKFMNKN